MVLNEFQRLLEDSGFQITAKQLDSMLAPDLRNLDVPKASVYVVDAHAARQATGALISNILDRFTSARLLVVGDNLKETESFALLRQGAKGIMTYAEAREQLPRALPQVAAGGIWVSRPVLSRFVDSILGSSSGRRLRVDSPNELSRREQEVLTGLLENLANKEVADRLHISEYRQVPRLESAGKNSGVRRRAADLIPFRYQRRGVNV